METNTNGFCLLGMDSNLEKDYIKLDYFPHDKTTFYGPRHLDNT